ncbi:hypothetical protein M514_10164 [Trichuris suis]|uniref:Peptidase S9 prolyl oligopeptidase catalytic domain-containing protein n=1 Tax=Trichuris suis TaxID=68888 RepID=A0A085NG89_9BILA|nr:hypothetical protein M514_10164 [Trichuris suis]
MRTMTSRVGPYGFWESSITSSYVTSISRVFLELRVDPTEAGKGIVYWLERRLHEGGRGVVCSKIVGGETLEWTPSDYSVRSSVHEYGGGSFFVHSGSLYFVRASDNHFYKQSAHNQPPVCVTESDNRSRYADGFLALNGIYCVREDHDEKSVKNLLVRIDLASRKEILIADGADFYSGPQVSSNGKSIVWMQWNFPNMPWDSTEVWMASLAEDGSITAGTTRKILSTAGTSYMQPKFSEDGELYFISDESNWWNLYKYSGIGAHKNLTPIDREVGGPQWQLGESAYSFDPTGTGDLAIICDGELNIVNRKSDLCYRQETGYFEHSYIAFGQDRCIYCIASDATKFQAVIRWNALYGVTDVIERVHEELDATLISVPELIAFPPALSESEGDGEPITIYGYFYNPVNPLYKPFRGSLPPLLVLAHGGPTGRCSRCLDLRIQYYTSRGFAVLNVDYRGSSGYGRQYRELLKSKLGIYDVDDCCSGALYLAGEGKVDPNMLCISGRSAGGFVVLASLAFKDVFSAGVCHYGISDLVALQESSCKYELHYFDKLVAPYPDQIATYRERSPINFIERIRAPVAFFHGTDDKIVPVDQIKRMHELLKRKGLMTSLVLFEGEGHGYRTDSNIRTALDGEYNFFCQALNINTECLTHKESVH